MCARQRSISVSANVLCIMLSRGLLVVIQLHFQRYMHIGCRCQYAHGFEELRKPNPGGSVPGGMSNNSDRGEGRGGPNAGPPFPPGMMV